MKSRIRRKNSLNSQSAFFTRSTVYNLHFVLTGLVLLFLFERTSSPDLNIEARKKIQARLSWPPWLMCGLYFEELLRTSTMIEQLLLYTNIRQTQIRGFTIWLLLIPLCVSQRVLKWTRYGSPRCEHFVFLIQVAFLEVWKCDLRSLFLLNHTNILLLST